MGFYGWWRVGLVGLCALNLPMIAVAQKPAPKTIDRLDEVNDGIEIPFTYDPITQPFIVVPVCINGGKPLPFLVDTGLTAPIIIDKRIARRLKLQNTGKVVIASPGNKRFAIARLRKVEIGQGGKEDTSITFDNLDWCWVGDLGILRNISAEKPIVGAIGVSILEPITIRFDFSTRRMTFFAKPHPPLRIRDAATIPMVGYDDLYFVPISPHEGISYYLILDTGSNLTEIPRKFQSQLCPIGRRTSRHRDIAGLHISEELLLPNVKIGTFTEPDVDLVCESGRSKMSLGLNILSRFRITLDFPNREMTLERPIDYANRIHIQGDAHITLRRRHGKYYVRKLQADSVAARAGLRKGDCIVEVDGGRLASLPRIFAYRLLDGFANTSARLTLRRAGGKLVTVTFVRASAYKKPKTPGVQTSTGK